jgi:predicted O-methyltransferase YrrM
MKYALVQLPRPSDAVVNYGSGLIPLLRHPVWAWLGLRPALAQHTAPEHLAIRRWAAERRSLVEIGVAEGVSALAMREAMAKDATLYLVDPFHLSRVPAMNFTRRAARRAVESCPRGRVVWIESLSHDLAQIWNTVVDLLMIDGDHSDLAVETDWEEWARFVVPGGIVIFHDARVFEGGWTTQAYGPVKLVDRLFRNGRASDWEIVEEIHSLVVVQRRR